MKTPSNSPQDARPLFKGGRSKSVDAGMLDVPPLCYKNPNRVRRSHSSTSLHSSSMRSTSGPPNDAPTSNPSAGGIDSAATDPEEKTPVLGSQNLKVKLTKVSPRGSLYELNPAALRLNIPSPICWNRVEDAQSEVPRRNDQFTLDGGMQRSSHGSPPSPTSRRFATLPCLSAVTRPLKKFTSIGGSKRDLAVAAELMAFTEGAFEWLAEQVLLEGFDIDGNNLDEEPSIPSSSVGSCDVWDFSPPTPSNLPLPLLPVPLIVDGRGHVQDPLRQSRIEREIRYPNSSERGFDPQVSQGDTSDVQATSSTYSYMKTWDSVCEGGTSSTIAADTQLQRDQIPALLLSEQDPLSRYHPSSTGLSQTSSSPTASEPRIQSNVAAISDTTVLIPTFICCQLKRLHSEPEVEAQTPPTTTPGRPRANTVDGFVPKSRSIFATPRKMSGNSLVSLSSSRIVEPTAIDIATQASFNTTNTKSLFATVGHSIWDSATTGERVVWAPQKVLPGTSHSYGRAKNSTSIHEASNPVPFASVGSSGPRSGRILVSPELCKVAKNFSCPTRLL